jgi:hypothetical protein
VIHWLNELIPKNKIPFNREKDAVIIGRGKLNRDRFLFNLEKVNCLFLHHKPPQWALNYYKKAYPDHYKKSLYTVIHGSHLREILEVKKYGSFPILSWKGSRLKGVKCNNVSTATVDYMGQVLSGRNIYLSAFDFTTGPYWTHKECANGKIEWWQCERDWSIEARHIKDVINKNKKNKYRFITYNRFCCKSELETEQHKNRMYLYEYIDEEFTNSEIEWAYTLTAAEIEREPGELMREKYLKNER